MRRRPCPVCRRGTHSRLECARQMFGKGRRAGARARMQHASLSLSLSLPSKATSAIKRHHNSLERQTTDTAAQHDFAQQAFPKSCPIYISNSAKHIEIPKQNMRSWHCGYPSFQNGEILLSIAPEPSCFAAHPMRVKCAAEAEVFQGWWHHFILAWLALSVCPKAKSSNRPNQGEGRKEGEGGRSIC